jgi:hypothetical protein
MPEIRVSARGKQEATIKLIRETGQILLQSDPPGATILINDVRQTPVTPTTLTLSPGRYRITLEKGDLKESFEEEVRDGSFVFRAVNLLP